MSEIPQNHLDTTPTPETEATAERKVIAILKMNRSFAERTLLVVNKTYGDNCFELEKEYLHYSPYEFRQLQIDNSAWEKANPKIVNALETAYLWTEFIAELAGLEESTTQQILDKLVAENQALLGQRPMGTELVSSYCWSTTIEASAPDIKSGAQLALGTSWSPDELY